MSDASLIARQLLSDLRRDFGLTDAQAAGVVGNLMHESGNFEHLQEINPVVSGSRGGWGFAQWTGPRRKSFDNYVEREGLDPNSYAANYGFLKHEVANNRFERGNFNRIKKAETAEEAARIFSKEYLRPGTPHMASRLQYTATAAELAALPPLPPGEIPNGVGTATDTRRPNKAYAVNDSGRLVDLSSGAVIPPSSPVAKSIAAGREAIGNERPPKIAPRPLMKQETMDRTLNLLADRRNPPMPVDPSLRPDAPPPPARALLPAIPPSTLAKVLNQPSASDRARGQTPAPKRETVGQSRIETGAPRGLVDAIRGRNLGDDLAVSFIKGGPIDQPQEDAWYDAEQGAMRLKPTLTGEMPTLASVRAAFKLDPFKTAPPPQTQVAQVSASDRARGQRPAGLLEALQGQPTMQSAGGRQPPVTAPYSTPLSASDRARLAQNAPKASAPRETGTEVSLGDVMSPRFPEQPGPSWNDFTGVMGRPAVASPAAPIKTAERLPNVSAMAFEPMAAAPVTPPPPPYKGPFVPSANAVPTYRTVMRDAQIENPAYTRWKQDTLNKPGKIPLGDVYHGLSRDSMAQAAAGRNFAATMPAKWVTIQKPTQVRIDPVAPRQVAVPQAVAPQRPVVNTLARPAPVRNGGLFGAITSGAGSTLGGLFGKLVGPNVNVGGMVQSGVNGVVGKVMADPMRLAMSMPPGAYLGPAANGGAMFRSHGGVANNLTQASDWWQVVTGQSDRSRGDGGAQSLSGTQN